MIEGRHRQHWTNEQIIIGKLLKEIVSKLHEKIKNKTTQEIKQFEQNMHLKLNEEWKRTPLRNKLI